MLALMSLCPKLAELHWSRCSQLTDAVVLAVAANCKNPNSPNSIDIGGCSRVSDAAVICVCFV